MRKHLLLILIAVVLQSATTWAQDLQKSSAPLAITGHVVSPEGYPVAGAEVQADIADRSGLSSHAITDWAGKFSINGIAPGRYRLHASKESEGYLDSGNSFYRAGSETQPEITVVAGQVTVDVVIRLSPKPAKLTGKIIDANTGEAIEDAQFFLCRKDSPKNCYKTDYHLSDGHFELLVPPFPFTLEVSAQAYKNWSYRTGKSDEQVDAIELAPTAIKQISISLYPKR